MSLPTQTSNAFETVHLPVKYDYLAPDGSEIRLLPTIVNRGGFAHCTLPPGGISCAVAHRTVDEIWYFLSGQGKVWRKQGVRDETVKVEPGICLTIPVGTHFQFCNTADEPLCFIISTMPPWPGEQEAVRVQDHWAITSTRS